jgi:HD-like signal output (HDOD) protein
MDDFLLYSIESFPPMPESITKLNELYARPEINSKEVEGIIQADPVLYTDILHYSNSPHYGFRTRLSTIAQVISLLGHATLHGMAIISALRAHPFTNLSPYGVTTAQWLDVMQKQQSFLQIWLGKEDRQLLTSLGGLPFILEIGRLVASYALMFSQNPYSFSKTAPLDLLLEEQNIIGSSGDELACKLFKMWFFDPLLIDTLRYSFLPQEGIKPQACAALQCTRTLFSLKGETSFDSVKPLVEKYGFDTQVALEAYQTILGETV